jgi:hypothetical protein
MEVYTCIKTFEPLWGIKPILYCKYITYKRTNESMFFRLRVEPYPFLITRYNILKVDIEYLSDYFIKTDDHRSKIIDKIKNVSWNYTLA